MTGRQLILCADDYALSPAVSAGIRAALAAGRLSATSAITNRPDWRAAARALDGLPGAIGLHINLTLGAPLSPMPLFAKGGRLPGIGRVTRLALTGRLPLAEIQQEIRRQFDRFEQELGRAPDFVDGHQHVHALPGIRSVLMDALATQRRPPSFWVRDPGDTIARIMRRGVEVPKAFAIAGLSSGFRAAARALGTNDGFSGFSSFDTARDFGDDFTRYLRAPGLRHLVMCHPGYVDDDLVAVDPVTTRREQELEFLLSSRFSEILDGAGMSLSAG